MCYNSWKKEAFMKLDVIFAGTKFFFNEPLREYALRSVKKSCREVASIRFYKDAENSLFLELEEMLAKDSALIIIASKQNYATIGKLLCTITEDNLTLKEEHLIPSKAVVYEKSSYLIAYRDASVNVLMLDEMQKMPPVLLECEDDAAVMQLFGESESSAKVLLETLSQTYDVKLEFVTLIEGWLEVHIYSKKHGSIAAFMHSAKQLLPGKVILASNIMTYIIERLAEHKKSITFAESCTGGLLSYFLTRNNGASKVLNGALITYANDIKANWLAVDRDVLETFGAVSAEVVRQMSEGALSVSEADYAISVSGIAGDSGGTPQKPVGTVFIGIRSRSWHHEEHLLLQGDRNYVQYQSVLYAIKMLIMREAELFFA